MGPSIRSTSVLASTATITLDHHVENNEREYRTLEAQILRKHWQAQSFQATEAHDLSTTTHHYPRRY